MSEENKPAETQPATAPADANQTTGLSVGDLTNIAMIFDVASSYHLNKFRNYEFNGFIDSVESFGVFIKAINFPFSGLARYSRTFDSKYEEKNKHKYKLGQIVKFKIKRINNRNGKILLFKVKKLGNDAQK